MKPNGWKSWLHGPVVVAASLLTGLLACRSGGPSIEPRFECSDPVIQQLFEASADTSVARSAHDTLVQRWNEMEALSLEGKSYLILPLLRDPAITRSMPRDRVHRFLFRDLLGVAPLNSFGKEITIRLSGPDLGFCRGVLPVGSDSLVVDWELSPPIIVYRVEAPRGYRVRVENNSPFKLIPQQELDRKYQEMKELE